MTKNQLDKAIQKAQNREYKDDHLTNAERWQLVAWYVKQYPDEAMPSDFEDAYMQVIG